MRDGSGDPDLPTKQPRRFGQSKAVFAYCLMARDTVEEKIAELQATKRELADAIYAEDAGLIRTLRPEDVEWLLS